VVKKLSRFAPVAIVFFVFWNSNADSTIFINMLLSLFLLEILGQPEVGDL